MQHLQDRLSWPRQHSAQLWVDRMDETQRQHKRMYDWTLGSQKDKAFWSPNWRLVFLICLRLTYNLVFSLHIKFLTCLHVSVSILTLSRGLVYFHALSLLVFVLFIAESVVLRGDYVAFGLTTGILSSFTLSKFYPTVCFNLRASRFIRSFVDAKDYSTL